MSRIEIRTSNLCAREQTENDSSTDLHIQGIIDNGVFTCQLLQLGIWDQ